MGVTLTEVIQRLQASKGQIAAIARASGVPEKTLRKIYSGKTEDPRGKTVDRLRDYFLREPGQ
jgi:predicted transcriptional regulator